MGERYEKKHEPEVEMIWGEDAPVSKEAAESYTQAEIQQLRAENERLKTIIKGLEREAARMEEIYERVVNGAKDAIDKWKAENASLKAEIETLQKTIAKASAEVFLRR